VAAAEDTVPSSSPGLLIAMTHPSLHGHQIHFVDSPVYLAGTGRADPSAPFAQDVRTPDILVFFVYQQFFESFISVDVLTGAFF
jgi:hypothetical protein